MEEIKFQSLIIKKYNRTVCFWYESVKGISEGCYKDKEGKN